MSKRSHSPYALPPAKRRHTIKPKPQQTPLAIADALYDELILTILSYLSWSDLCVVQLINRNWARLAVDGELWRKQYLTTFGKPRLRGVRGPPGRLDGREVKPLPARVQATDSVPKDWKWMFRISSNWRKGRCSVEELPCIRRPESSGFCSGSSDYFNCHLLLFGDLMILASSRPSFQPIIDVTSSTESCRIVCRPTHMEICRVVALAIDQSAPASGLCKVLTFLSTGEIMCYQLQQCPLSLSQQFHYLLPGRRSRYPVVHAVYHHPLLVTLAQDFTISLYNLEFDTFELMQTLSSFTSFPPVSLVLSTPSPSIYKLIIAYATPVHPRHWTAGATELIISGTRMAVVDSAPSPSQHDPSPSFTSPSGSPYLTVLSTRTARAIDVPFGWIDERKLRIMREQWSRKVTQVADIQTDGKWVILAPGDQLTGFGHASSGSALTPSHPTPKVDINNHSGIEMNTFTAQPLHSPTSLQLYRLILPSPNSVSSSPPRLSFVRTLHGQTGPIVALSLSDGRCVSLSLNGSIWVWDLEAGTGAQVSAANIETTQNLILGPDSEPIRASVSFDEKRLIIAQSDSVIIRRFDV